MANDFTGVNINMTDNSDEVRAELDEKKYAILIAWGIAAEGFAKRIMKEKGVVDTGLLRNSITHAIEGEKAAIDHYKADKPDKQGRVREGVYTETAPSLLEPHKTRVYIGSNQPYSVYQEEGNHGKPGRPFLRPAIEDFKDQYKQIAKNTLEK